MASLNMSIEAINNRIKNMVDRREEIFYEGIDNYHVRLMKGNSKTGVNCYTVSLIPGADCPNCTECLKTCYDIRNVCWLPNVAEQRSINSAIHKYDLERFWKEIDIQIKAMYVQELRINVGGDLTEKDFPWVDLIGIHNPICHILFFTKNYKGINNYLDRYGDFPKNVHAIMSAWIGMEMDNSHNLPVAHVLWKDGTTTAFDFSAKFCGGNCSECFHHKLTGDKANGGCWTMEKGDAVIFNCH